MAAVDPDHLDTQRSEFSNSKQILHLALLSIGEPNRVEGQRRVAE
jgi:hypothetical protein